MSRHVCFELDGARVHGDPAMNDASRAALREIIDAGRRLLAESVPAAPVPPTTPRASTDLPGEPPP